MNEFGWAPIMLRKNDIVLTDSLWIPFGLEQNFDNTFFNVETITVNYFDFNEKADNSKEINFALGWVRVTNSMTQHERVVYNLWDLLGDYGGFKEGLSILIILLIGPLPEYFYYLKAIQKLFLAQTVDLSLFNNNFRSDKDNIKRVERKKRAE